MSALHRPVDVALRVAGLLVPIAVTALVPTRWTLVGDGIFWYLVLVGFAAGALLRSWWALLLVPATNLGIWVMPVIIQDKQLFGGDFVLISGVIVLIALHLLMAASTAFGFWAGKRIEMSIAPRNTPY